MRPRVSSRARVRDSALQVIRLAGGHAAAGRSRWRSQRLLIACYHGFAQADEDSWNPSLYVTADHLESRLRFLDRAGYTVLPLREGLARLASGTLPPRAVAITVDDGTYDFYAVAYPVLKRAGVPVTVYVSTYYVFDQRPVFDGACHYLLWKAWASGRTGVPDPSTEEGSALRTAEDFSRAAIRVVEAARAQAWSADKKHEWLSALAGRLELDWPEFLRRRLITLMRPEEIATLDPAIVDVQLHTHRHRVPPRRDLFLREISDNRRALAECGIDPAGLTEFCYPNGEHGPAFLTWLAEAGVRSAVTCVPGLASVRHHSFLLPRFIDTGSTSAVEFEGWVSGLRQLLGRAGAAPTV
jgi:peptidoglycan/xylan/chitin deacetylase (PgdA/CDA1 family)